MVLKALNHRLEQELASVCLWPPGFISVIHQTTRSHTCIINHTWRTSCGSHSEPRGTELGHVMSTCPLADTVLLPHVSLETWSAVLCFYALLSPPHTAHLQVLYESEPNKKDPRKYPQKDTLWLHPISICLQLIFTSFFPVSQRKQSEFKKKKKKNLRQLRLRGDNLKN